MYSKLYRTIFDGSLYGQFEAITVFMAMLALADRHGEVDVTPRKIADCLGCDADFAQKGLEALEAEDPYSRTPAENGKRIIPLLDDEGNPRIFGWKIVNYDKYRSIRNEEERRSYKRTWDRENRSKKSETTKVDRNRPRTTYTEAEAEVLKPSKSDDLDFDLFWNNYPKKVDKKKAKKSFDSLTKKKKDKATQDCLTRYEGQDKKYIPNPTTYIHGERWEDETGQIQEKFGAGGI